MSPRPGWQWVSTNDSCWLWNHCEQQALLVEDASWFQIAFCQSQLLITMYTKCRWLYLYLANIQKMHNNKTIIVCLFLFVSLCFIVELSLDKTPHLDVSQPRGRWSEQPITFAKDYAVRRFLHTTQWWRHYPLEKFSYTSASSINCVIWDTLKCKM